MDLNNLITTIISSTAALVAIIGGFLVSRVISLSSEQSVIKRRIREIDNDILAKKELVKKIDQYLFEDNLSDFVKYENIERMIKGKSLDYIIDVDEYTYLTKEELEPYFEQLVDIKNELFEIIENSDGGYNTFIYRDLNEVFDFDNIKYPNRKDWYEIIFEVWVDLNTPKSKPNIFAGILSPPIPNLTHYPINTDYKDNEKERNRLLDDLSILNLQKEGQLKTLADYGKPKFVRSGLLVLIYASIVSIIYPSTLLPYPKETYDDILTKWTILSLFYSQLLVLFIYLGWAMYKLTRAEDEKN